uniref:Uncharacterized protein n=1 Tax=Globodera rostochiensis TaxID=31243 RepID=A0A914H8W7_GLORO
MESLNSTSIYEQTPETTPATSTPVSSSSPESDSVLNLITYFLISADSIIHIVTLAISTLNLMVLTSIQFAVFLQMILWFFGYFRSSTIHLLFIERLIASVWLEKYESYKKATFSICWCTFVIALCFINVATNGQMLRSSTLNIVTAFVLQFLSLAECVFIISENSMHIIFTSFIACGSILNAIVETTIITHHPVLKKRFNFLLNKFFRCHGGQVTDAIVQRQQQNDGTPAIKKNGKAEFEGHFKMMDELWK